MIHGIRVVIVPLEDNTIERWLGRFSITVNALACPVESVIAKYVMSPCGGVADLTHRVIEITTTTRLDQQPTILVRGIRLSEMMGFRLGALFARQCVMYGKGIDWNSKMFSEFHLAIRVGGVSLLTRVLDRCQSFGALRMLYTKNLKDAITLWKRYNVMNFAEHNVAVLLSVIGIEWNGYVPMPTECPDTINDTLRWMTLGPLEASVGAAQLISFS